jgi:hypothetical protein
LLEQYPGQGWSGKEIGKSFHLGFHKQEINRISSLPGNSNVSVRSQMNSQYESGENYGHKTHTMGRFRYLGYHS